MISGVVHFLNDYKEPVKNILSVPKFLSGIFGVLGFKQDLRELNEFLKNGVDEKTRDRKPFSLNTAVRRICKIMAQLSMVLSSTVSHPGQAVIGWTATRIVGEAQLTRLFGPNLNFVTNPMHPKHFVSIAAFLLGLPAFLISMYDGITWAFSGSLQTLTWDQHFVEWINDWNTVTSRVTIHIGNAILSRRFVA